VFEQNLTDFKAKAEKIKNNFVKNTENKKLNNFVIFHEAYGYLFHEMNIDVSKVVVLQETAGRETSVNEMKHIVDEIKEHNVKVLYKEPQLDTKLINTLVEKHNLELSELDPLGKTIEKN
jgi:zinc transport system substrate-binding protein